jgi:hypothetical protein
MAWLGRSTVGRRPLTTVSVLDILDAIAKQEAGFKSLRDRAGAIIDHDQDGRGPPVKCCGGQRSQATTGHSEALAALANEGHPPGVSPWPIADQFERCLQSSLAGQILRRFLDNNFTTADENNFGSWVRLIAPYHHRHVVQINPKGRFVLVRAFCPRRHGYCPRIVPRLDPSTVSCPSLQRRPANRLALKNGRIEMPCGPKKLRRQSALIPASLPAPTGPNSNHSRAITRRGHVDRGAIGQRHHGADTGDRHQPATHFIFSDDSQQAAMVCSRSVRRTRSSGSTSIAKSGRFSTSEVAPVV